MQLSPRFFAGKKNGGPASPNPPVSTQADDDVLQRYLRGLRAHPTLERDAERKVARAIGDTRRALADLIERLPEPWRSRVLGGDAPHSPEARSWPLESLLVCSGRLLGLEDDPEAGELLETITLARCHRTRLKDSRETLIVSNLPLVVHMAAKMRNCGVSFPDLIQEGNLGLIRAVDKYEWQRGFRFSTYAVWWIRSGLSKALLERSRLVRLPPRQREQVYSMKRVIADLVRESGRQPSVPEVANRMQVPESEICRLMESAQDPVPLEEANENGNGVRGPVSVTPSTADDGPLAAFQRRQLRLRVAEVLGRLRPRERRIMEMRFGLEDGQPRTLREVGEAFDLSRERIRQIERLALGKLRRMGRVLSELNSDG